jgi:hypothetical protein
MLRSRTKASVSPIIGVRLADKRRDSPTEAAESHAPAVADGPIRAEGLGDDDTVVAEGPCWPLRAQAGSPRSSAARRDDGSRLTCEL